MSDKLLRNTEISGVFHLAPGRHDAIETASQLAHLRFLKVDIVGPSSAPDVLRQLGSALDFPTWYGANFDALYDCLADPDWQPAKGHILLINGLTRLRRLAPEDFATLIEVFQAVVEARRKAHTPFWILIDAPARGIPTLPAA
ncbi:MAG: hypothetical protein CVU33_16505 [Betaproteobacteria bacterium HGW-Betaproteobacteria-6]|jgi:RNAse (barnase) inhibitor barstar|nr:MAG: hypothetical protein CVU33_16505 [Betaproteobacteria bacterium HGW-Betaproteobacteria-6]